MSECRTELGRELRRLVAIYPERDPLTPVQPSPSRALVMRFEDWSVDELDVLGVVAQRLALGRERYGRLDLATDERDWARELSEELADVLVYSAMLRLQLAAPGGEA